MTSTLLLKGPFRSGVPLGGLGTGKIELWPTGRLNRLTFRNNWDRPLHGGDPGFLGFHFAVRARQAGRAAVRLLERTGPAGAAQIPGWIGVRSLDYRGAFPKAVLRYADPALPLQVTLEAFFPLIPHDERASGMPACAFRFTLRNASRKPCEVSLLAVGRNLCGTYAVGRVNRVVRWNNAVELRFENPLADPREPESGSMGLLMPRRKGHAVTALGQWNIQAEHFRADRRMDFRPLGAWRRAGRLPDLPGGRPATGGSVEWGGALADSFRLPPRGQKEVPVVLSWHFPAPPEGHAYSARFRHASSAGRRLLARRAALSRGVEAWHRRVERSGLPGWLSAGLVNSLAPLAAGSRWARDGRFWLYESPSVCPYLGTLDVRFYGSLPLLLLFPELEKRELLEFARAQRPDGYIPHDLGWIRPGAPGDGTTPFLWKDLAPKFALLAWRDASWTRDARFLKTLYPAVRRALRWQMEQDEDGDGLPDHEGADHTFDVWPFHGASAYASGLTLAALKAAARMAREMGRKADESGHEAAFNRTRAAFEKALWNGRYFDCWKKGRSASTACTSAQLAGQWAADLLDLGPIVEPALLRRALGSMLSLNGRASPYGAPNAVRPSGRPESSNRHARNIFVGISYTLAALAIRHEEEARGMALARKTWLNLALRQRTPWDQPDMVSSRSGRKLFGDFYMRNMGIWAVAFALAPGHPPVARMIRSLGAPGGVRPSSI